MNLNHVASQQLASSKDEYDDLLTRPHVLVSAKPHIAVVPISALGIACTIGPKLVLLDGTATAFSDVDFNMEAHECMTSDYSRCAHHQLRVRTNPFKQSDLTCIMCTVVICQISTQVMNVFKARAKHVPMSTCSCRHRNEIQFSVCKLGGLGYL